MSNNSPPLSDETISRYQAGDMAAYKEIYDQLSGLIYNIVYKMIRHPEQTEDLVHDIFVKLYEKRHKFSGEAKFSTWAYKLAVNHTLNDIKSRQLRQSKLGQIFFNAKQYDEITDNQEDHTYKAVHDALQTIKPVYRICLILREFQELSYEEIAQTLNLNIGTVRSRINRARESFKQSYSEMVTDDKSEKEKIKLKSKTATNGDNDSDVSKETEKVICVA